MVVAKSIGEIVANKLDSVKEEWETKNEENQDMEIGRDSIEDSDF